MVCAVFGSDWGEIGTPDFAFLARGATAKAAASDISPRAHARYFSICVQMGGRVVASSPGGLRKVYAFLFSFFELVSCSILSIMV